MSLDEFRETLIRLGISKPNGELTAKYATPPKRHSKVNGKVKATR